MSRTSSGLTGQSTRNVAARCREASLHALAPHNVITDLLVLVQELKVHFYEEYVKTRPSDAYALAALDKSQRALMQMGPHQRIMQTEAPNLALERTSTFDVNSQKYPAGYRIRETVSSGNRHPCLPTSR